MHRTLIASLLVFASGCNAGLHGLPAGEQVDAAMTITDAGDPPVDPDAAVAPAICNGYEPCAVNPVVVPPGYTLQNYINYDDYGIYGTCTAFEDCGMWNLHYTMQWIDGNTSQPVAQYYNRMSSPFPWSGSRYEIDVASKKIQYATFHMTAPNEMYKFSDGTLETRTDRATGAITCFKRGPGQMERANLGNLGGTGNGGKVQWNISVLPGDMGNSGNASRCSGQGNTTTVFLTSDPVVAASTLDSMGNPVLCLLREGKTYYLNFMSSGVLGNFDCTTQTCTMGGFQLTNFVGSDGSQAPQVEVPCP
jgi:hypothetical protein